MLRVAVLVLGAYVVFGYVLLPVRGVGISMQPTIVQDDLMFINTLAYRFRPPRRGEIVAVRLAGRSAVYVKRLLALPGDRVAFVNGVLWLNGEALDEPYAQRRHDWNLGEVAMGPDDYFVLGDNRSMRMEHHDFGTTTADRLVGPKVF